MYYFEIVFSFFMCERILDPKKSKILNITDLNMDLFDLVSNELKINKNRKTKKNLSSKSLLKLNLLLSNLVL